MTSFGPAALIGLCIGFLWGIGCSLAILYSIYLGGYRKGLEDSLAERKPERYRKALEKIQQKLKRQNSSPS
ncbi:MAG TPA: hypothetical protein VGL00_19515 [Terracidiphilus sp.]|jgi:hypothetical protein